MRALVTGATGFVGGRLALALAEDGVEVRCLVRDAEGAEAARLAEAGCELAEGDISDAEAIEAAMRDVDVAYFLVHMMGRRDDWAEAEKDAARLFGESASAAGVERVIYVGGLDDGSGGSNGDERSEHLQSRHDVSVALEETGPPLTYFRAAMIIGGGSESYELLRSIVTRVPALPKADWLHSRTQPIGVRDVVSFLRMAPHVPESAGREVQLGGPDVLTHLEVVDAMARELGRKAPRKLRLPGATPEAVAAAAGTVTTGTSEVAVAITKGLPGDTVVSDESGMQLFDVEPESLSVALQRAIEEEEEEKSDE